MTLSPETTKTTDARAEVLRTGAACYTRPSLMICRNKVNSRAFYGVLRGSAPALVALALVSPCGVLAQESPRSEAHERAERVERAERAERVWSEATVRQAARRRSPEVRRARTALAVAHAGRVFGDRPPVGNPTVGVVALPGWPDFTALTYAVSVGLPIDVSGARGAYHREADQEIRVAEDRLFAAVHTAEQRARSAWVELSLVRSLTAVQRERLSAATAAEAGVQARVEAGAATVVEATLAQRERAEAAADLASASRREVEALDAFRTALDLGPDETVTVETAARPQAVDRATMAALRERAEGRRRDLSAMRHTAQRWELTAQRQRASAIAPLTLGIEAQQVAVGPQEVANSLGASVRWELPFVQRAQGDQAVSRAEAAGETVNAELLRRQIGREVTTAAARLELALAELDAIEHDAVPAAQRLVSATEASWAAGAFDFFRVFVARRDLLVLRGRAIEALRTAWQARIAFDRAVGPEPAPTRSQRR